MAGIKFDEQGLVDNFEFDLIGAENAPFVGYVSSKDKTTVSSQAMIHGSLNVYKRLSETIAIRPGQKRRGSPDATEAGVKSSFEWSTSRGVLFPLRVANGKLQFESDAVTSGTFVWYDLMTGLSLTRFVFDSWWSQAQLKDILVFVKGDTNLHYWSGAMSTVASTTANTITITATSATLAGFFFATGNLVVNGNTYAYTGISGSQFTGVTPDPTGEANGSVIYEAISTAATTPDSFIVNDFLRVINNQVYIGSYTSRLIYISKSTDFSDYSVPGSRVAGDPELLTLDDTGRGIIALKGKAHISAGNSLWYSQFFQDITVGAVLTQQTIVEPLPVPNLQAALAHEFIDAIGNEIIFLDQNNQLRVLGDFAQLFEAKFPALSLAVQQELVDEDFTGGHLRSVGDRIYITAPINGRVWQYVIRQNVNKIGQITSERFWDAPFIWNLSRIAVIDGVEYGHSNANPQIYQLWDTNQWHDDGPSSDGLGSEILTNGNFDGNADNWNFTITPSGVGWVYGSNKVTHTVDPNVLGYLAEIQQILGIGPGTYTVSITIGGTTGTVQILLGTDLVTYAAGVGSVTFPLTDTDGGADFAVRASYDFNGYVDSISVKQQDVTAIGLPYDGIMRMAYRQHGRRQGMINFDKVYYEGYMTQGTTLYSNIYYDYQGASGIGALVLNNQGSAPFYTGIEAPSLGDASPGDNPLGDGLTIETNDQEQLPKFRIIVGTPPTDVFEYAIEVFTNAIDSRWEILCLGTDAVISDNQAVQIRR